MKNKIEIGLVWAIAISILLAMIGVKYGWGTMLIGGLFALAVILSGVYYCQVETEN